MKISKLKSFDTFINLIESGIIRISLKIGIFRTGKKIGQIPDQEHPFALKNTI